MASLDSYSLVAYCLAFYAFLVDIRWDCRVLLCNRTRLGFPFWATHFREDYRSSIFELINASENIICQSCCIESIMHFLKGILWWDYYSVKKIQCIYAYFIDLDTSPISEVSKSIGIGYVYDMDTWGKLEYWCFIGKQQSIELIMENWDDILFMTQSS